MADGGRAQHLHYGHALGGLRLELLGGGEAGEVRRDGGHAQQHGEAALLRQARVQHLEREGGKKFCQSASCSCFPLFRVLFCVSKTEDDANLTHFAYNSWTGNDPAEVPSKPHGLIDLVEHAMAHKVEQHLSGPIAVHCK